MNSLAFLTTASLGCIVFMGAGHSDFPSFITWNVRDILNYQARGNSLTDFLFINFDPAVVDYRGKF